MSLLVNASQVFEKGDPRLTGPQGADNLPLANKTLYVSRHRATKVEDAVPIALKIGRESHVDQPVPCSGALYHRSVSPAGTE
jgi:hypothetical protein